MTRRLITALGTGFVAVALLMPAAAAASTPPEPDGSTPTGSEPVELPSETEAPFSSESAGSSEPVDTSEPATSSEPVDTSEPATSSEPAISSEPVDTSATTEPVFTPLAVVVPGSMEVAGCTATGVAACTSSPTDDSVWGSAATETDPARGLPGFATAEVRWTIPNDGTEPFTLSDPQMTTDTSSGMCSLWNSSGVPLGSDSVAPGDHAFVTCQDGFRIEFGPAEPVTLEVTATDVDGDVPLSTTVWVDNDAPIDISWSDGAVLADSDCSATIASATLQFSATVTDSAAALVRLDDMMAGTLIWLDGAGGLTFDLEPVNDDASLIVGSEPVLTSTDDSTELTFDPRLVYAPGSGGGLPSYFGTGITWRDGPVGFTDTLTFDIPVTFDRDEPLGELSFHSGVNISGFAPGTSNLYLLANPCIPTPTTSTTTVAPTTVAPTTVAPTTVTPTTVAPTTPATTAAPTSVDPAPTDSVATTSTLDTEPTPPSTTTVGAVAGELPETGASATMYLVAGVAALLSFAGFALMSMLRRR